MAQRERCRACRTQSRAIGEHGLCPECRRRIRGYQLAREGRDVLRGLKGMVAGPRWFWR